MSQSNSFLGSFDHSNLINSGKPSDIIPRDLSQILMPIVEEDDKMIYKEEDFPDYYVFKNIP